MTEEKITKLEEQYKQKKEELEKYENTSIEDIWKSELKEFSNAYDKWLTMMDREEEKMNSMKKKQPEPKRRTKKT